MGREDALSADGWKSVTEIAARWGVARCTADERLRTAHAAGKFDRCKARLCSGGTGMLYRPKPPTITNLVR